VGVMCHFMTSVIFTFWYMPCQIKHAHQGLHAAPGPCQDIQELNKYNAHTVHALNAVSETEVWQCCCCC
jgi:hypothetical protein